MQISFRSARVASRSLVCSLALQEKDIGDLQSRIFSTHLRKTNKSEAATDLGVSLQKYTVEGHREAGTKILLHRIGRKALAYRSYVVSTSPGSIPRMGSNSVVAPVTIAAFRALPSTVCKGVDCGHTVLDVYSMELWLHTIMFACCSASLTSFGVKNVFR